MRMLVLNQMLPADDEARTVVAFVEQVDLSELHCRIRAVEGRPNRSQDSALVVAVRDEQGGGSTRALNRLCVRHLSYQWICGDVSVNYHTLSDFRVAHGEFLDRLPTQQIAQLMDVCGHGDVGASGSGWRAGALQLE